MSGKGTLTSLEELRDVKKQFNLVNTEQGEGVMEMDGDEILQNLSGVIDGETNDEDTEEAGEEVSEETSTNSVEASQPTHNLTLVYSSNCLVCKHLVGEMELSTDTGGSAESIEYEDCHFSHGNPNCPAESYQIVIGVDVIRTAARLAAAMQGGDVIKVAKIHKRLRKVHPHIVQQVYKLAASNMVSHEN